MAGCSAKPNKEADSTKEHSVEESVTDTSNQQFSTDAGTSIDVLREEFSQSTALFGVAYIGYFDSAATDETDIDFGQWFHATSSPLAAYYPFISEIDEAHTIGTEGHLYCIIARDYDSSIAVNTIDDSEVLYRAENGDPILLFCNRDGDVQTADTTVIITAVDGTVCQWESPLDEMGHPRLLVGDERELLSWDFTPIPNTGFDLDGWLAEGWLEPTAVGVAYIDFLPNTEVVHDYNYASDFSTNNIFNVYPFFYEYPVSLNVGVEMFAVVPASTQSYIKVYKVNLDDNGDFIVDRDTVLYENKTGKPFILLCNDHEAYSNVLITVQDGDETVEFSPRISIENDDGLVLGEGCYDFTVKDIRDYHSEARESLTKNIDGIKDGIENGMSLRWDDEVYIYGHYALKYVLGKYDEDGTFDIAREYLIDEYYTMAFYEPEEDEKTIGWRVVGKGFEYNQARD